MNSFALEPTDALPLASPLPGQFVVLRLQPECNASPLMRSDSLSSAPGTARYRVSIKCEIGGAVGTFLGHRVGVGDTLEMSAPRGSFTLGSGERRHRHYAGAGDTARAGRRTIAARDLVALRCARRQAPSISRETLALLRLLPHSRSRIWYRRATPGDRLGTDFDAHGHVAVGRFDELGVPRQAELYLCGPTAFMKSLVTDLAAWGVAGQHIHTEVFGSGQSSAPGIIRPHHRLPHSPPGPAGIGPLVSFARSNLALRWHAKYRSLLELAEACDVPVRWSCRTGVCHRCETGLVAGTVDYRLEPLESHALGNVLVCCSQPRSDMLIDL